MNTDNPFDKKLALNSHVPSAVADGLVEVNDTLDFAWASVQSVFGENAKPEHALKICELMLNRIEFHKENEMK